MKSDTTKKVVCMLFAFGVFGLITAISVSAQSNIPGKYYFDTKIDNGRHDFRYLIELKSKNAAIYTNEQEGEETQKRFGTWSYKAGLLTIIMPPVKKNPMMGQEIKLTFVFKVIGNNLKLITDLPYKEGIGNLYNRM